MLRIISYLVSDSDPRNAAPGIGVLDTGKVALLKAKIRQGRKRLTATNRTNDPAGVNKVRREAASVGSRANDNGLFLRGCGRGVDIVSRRGIRADMRRLNSLRNLQCRVGHGGGSMGYRGLDLDVWGGCWSRPHTNWSGHEPRGPSARQKDGPSSPLPKVAGPSSSSPSPQFTLIFNFFKMAAPQGYPLLALENPLLGMCHICMIGRII